VSAPSSEGSVPLTWLLATILRAAAAACTASEHSPPAASLSPWHLTEGHSQCFQRRERAQLRRERAAKRVVVQVPVRRRRRCALSTVLPPPPPSVHGTSGTGTHSVVSAAIAPSSEGSAPLNGLLFRPLRAAATACALSTVLQLPPSVHGTSQMGTHNVPSAVSAPSSEGSVPLSWFLPKFLRRRRRQRRSQHSPSAAASLSPWPLTEEHSPVRQLRERAQL
jgi:hypothetical protein